MDRTSLLIALMMQASFQDRSLKTNENIQPIPAYHVSSALPPPTGRPNPFLIRRPQILSDLQDTKLSDKQERLKEELSHKLDSSTVQVARFDTSHMQQPGEGDHNFPCCSGTMCWNPIDYNLMR